MKKLAFFLVESLSMGILLLFALIVLFSFKVSAQALPEVSSYTFEVIEGGIQDAVSIGSQYKGISPYADSLIATYEIIGALFYEYENLTGDSSALWFCDDEDVIVRSLNADEVSYFENKPLYDRLGQIVDSSNVYYCSYNNGYFNGGCYLDSNGDILYESLDLDVPKRALANIAYGGSLVEWSDWNNFYNFLRSESLENQYNFSFDDVDYSDLSYFVWGGYLQTGLANGYIKQSVYIFCPNVLNFGYSQIYNTGSSLVNYRILYNEGSCTVDYDLHLGTNQTNYNYLGGFSSGNWTYSNYTYTYSTSFDYHVLSGDTSLDYSSFVDYVPNNNVASTNYYLFAYHNDVDIAKFNSLLQSDAKVTSFIPLQFPNGSVVNPSPIPNELVDLGSISELGNLSEIQPELNPDFDPSEVIDPSNYPEFVELPTLFPSPSTLPNNVSNNNPSDDPDVQPSLGENIGNIDSLNIPIISNLRYRFPFCIPFDIYNLLQGIAVERTTPIIDISFTMPVVNQTINFYYDMAPFDDTAQLFRTLFLISYIIGLAYFSYDHFFGK